MEKFESIKDILDEILSGLGGGKKSLDMGESTVPAADSVFEGLHDLAAHTRLLLDRMEGAIQLYGKGNPVRSPAALPIEVADIIYNEAVAVMDAATRTRSAMFLMHRQLRRKAEEDKRRYAEQASDIGGESEAKEATDTDPNIRTPRNRY